MWIKLAFLIVSCIVLAQQCSACGDPVPQPTGLVPSDGCRPNIAAMKRFCACNPKHPKCSCYKAWIKYCTPRCPHPLCKCCKWCKWV